MYQWFKFGHYLHKVPNDYNLFENNFPYYNVQILIHSLLTKLLHTNIQ